MSLAIKDPVDPDLSWCYEIKIEGSAVSKLALGSIFEFLAVVQKKQPGFPGIHGHTHYRVIIDPTETEATIRVRQNVDEKFARTYLSRAPAIKGDQVKLEQTIATDYISMGELLSPRQSGMSVMSVPRTTVDATST